MVTEAGRDKVVSERSPWDWWYPIKGLPDFFNQDWPRRLAPGWPMPDWPWWLVAVVHKAL